MHHEPISKVARATSAHPLYFKEMEYSNETLMENFLTMNFSRQIYFDIRIPGSGSSDLDDTIISVGSDQRDIRLPYDTAYGKAKHFHFNVGERPEDMRPDKWKRKDVSKTLQQLKLATETYLATPEFNTLLLQTAKRLVEMRRARAYQTHPDRLDRWE
ncbi:hypothetical protein MMC14_004445 [Varicellaria rhodocarpa]|nr:hypothetical protein [Varicellaria rhodocarpa]